MQRLDDTAAFTLPANAAVALTAVPLDDAVRRLGQLITGEALSALTRDDTPPPLALNWPTTFRVERCGMVSVLLWHGSWLAVAEESGLLDKPTRICLITPASDSPHERLRAAFPDAQFWESEHRCYDAVRRKPPQPREPIRLRRLSDADINQLIAKLSHWLATRSRPQPLVMHDGARLVWENESYSSALWGDDETLWARSWQRICITLSTSAPTDWLARLTGGVPLLTVEREDAVALALVTGGATPRIVPDATLADVAALRRLLYEHKLLHAGRPKTSDKWHGDAAAFWRDYQAAVTWLTRQRLEPKDAVIARRLRVSVATLRRARKRYGLPPDAAHK